MWTPDHVRDSNWQQFGAMLDCVVVKPPDIYLFKGYKTLQRELDCTLHFQCLLHASLAVRPVRASYSGKMGTFSTGVLNLVLLILWAHLYEIVTKINFYFYILRIIYEYCTNFIPYSSTQVLHVCLSDSCFLVFLLMIWLYINLYIHTYIYLLNTTCGVYEVLLMYTCT